jgi:Holliday junction resolvase RusA-like endonuclease
VQQLIFDAMEVEVIHGQIVAKANHYQAVPGKFGKKRIIKDEVIRAYEHSFVEQCKVYRNRRIATRFRLFVRVWHSSVKFDLDNSLKTLLDCLQMVGAITDDNLCFQIEAEKHLDKYHPRIEFALLEVNEQKQLFNN